MKGEGMRHAEGRTHARTFFLHSPPASPLLSIKCLQISITRLSSRRYSGARPLRGEQAGQRFELCGHAGLGLLQD